MDAPILQKEGSEVTLCQASLWNIALRERGGAHKVEQY